MPNAHPGLQGPLQGTVCDGEMGKMEYVVQRWERKRRGAAHVLWREMELETLWQ